MYILNQSILKKKVLILDRYMVLNPGKCYCMVFGLNATNNEFALEDGRII